MAWSFDGGANSVSDGAEGRFQRGWEVSWNEKCEWIFMYSCRYSRIAHRNGFARAMEVVIDVYLSLDMSLVFQRKYLQVNVGIYTFVFQRYGFHLCRLVHCNKKPAT